MEFLMEFRRQKEQQSSVQLWLETSSVVKKFNSFAVFVAVHTVQILNFSFEPFHLSLTKTFQTWVQFVCSNPLMCTFFSLMSDNVFMSPLLFLLTLCSSLAALNWDIPVTKRWATSSWDRTSGTWAQVLTQPSTLAGCRPSWLQRARDAQIPSMSKTPVSATTLSRADLCIIYT